MYKKVTQAFVWPALVIGLIGCASTATEGPTTTVSRSSEQDQVIAEQRERISSLESMLATRESELSEARSTVASPVMAGDSSSLFPPNPKLGECYARVLIPAQYSTSTVQVLILEEAERIEAIPARYETVTEQVLVREASTRVEVIPAEYEEVQERVLVRPASKRLEEVPATYRTVSEQVLDKPAHSVWKRGPASSFGADKVVDTRTTDTGEIMCLVEVPATYKTVKRTVVDTPAAVREVEVPAEYTTVSRRVVKRPAETREIEIPAEYGTVEVTKLVTPAESRAVKIPAEYDTVTKREKVADERLEWRQVVCEVNLTADNVRALQTALADAGHYNGPIDGIIGPKTLSAANGFATAKGLATGSNYIALDVVEALGLSI